MPVSIPNRELEYLYLDKKLSMAKIAKMFNVSPTTIHKRLHGYGIPARSISEALRGRVPWNKGKHLSERTKRKLSKISKGFWRDPKYKKKMEIRNKKMSKNMKGKKNPMKRLEVRKKVSKRMKGKLVGDKNPAKKVKTRRKISKSLNGHLVSQEVRDRIRRKLKGRYIGTKNPFYGKHHTKEVIEKSRIRAVKQLASGELGKKDTSIELQMENELKERRVYYKKQFPLNNITVVDFYLPKYRVVIYCDGTFWHKSEWARKQGVIEKDRKQTKILTANDYKVFRFLETEINNSTEKCVDKIINYISKI